ncbi:hypothetical protein [Kaarinaea lacus]
MSVDASTTVSKAMVVRTMAFVTLIVFILLSGCTGSSDGGAGTPPGTTGSTSDTNNSSGGSDTSGGTNNSPGTGSDSGGGTSGSGGSTDGGTGSGTGGDSNGGSASPGTLANLYRAVEEQRLNVNNCNMLANGSINFPRSRVTVNWAVRQ